MTASNQCIGKDSCEAPVTRDWLRPVSATAPNASAPPSVAVQHQLHHTSVDGGMLEIDSLSVLIHSLNSNPYLVGMFMLLLNLGGRFLAMELTPKQEQFLQQRWLRPFLFFIVIFVATRNLAVAFWITLFLFIVLWILANEKSPFCLVPGWREFENTEKRQTQYEQNMEIIHELNTHNTTHS